MNNQFGGVLIAKKIFSVLHQAELTSMLVSFLLFFFPISFVN